MKTKSGIYVEVAERPGVVEISVQYVLGCEPGGERDGIARSTAQTLFRVICGLAENLPPKDAVLGSVLAGPRPGWGLALKPLGAKRVADGLKPISSILTVEEARTLRGLLASARRWAEHPPMLTIIDVGCMPPGGIRHLLQRVVDLSSANVLPQEIQQQVRAVLTHEEWVGDRCLVDRRSLEALRAAPRVPAPATREDDRWDVRWARRSHLWRVERQSPEVWEPCKPTDEGAVLVVLP